MRKIWFLYLICLCGSLGAFGCARDLEFTKMMMDMEAQRSVHALFGTTYDPAESQLIDSIEIHKWIGRRKSLYEALPTPVQKHLKDKRAMGLLVHGIVPSDWEADMRLMSGDAVFLPMPMPKVRAAGGIGGYWLPDALPCNGGFREHCTGCEGLGRDGLYHTCVCTNTCKEARECPQCGQ